MAVYTDISVAEAGGLLDSLHLGQLQAMEGCRGGIENTNYFVTTHRHGHPHDYVLTVFERLTFEQLPFYLRLMQHLADRGIPLPRPHGDDHGELVFRLKGKPAAVVDKLLGSSELSPGLWHCDQVGTMLARMHLAGSDFGMHQPNLRGLAWWNETVPVTLPYLSPAQASLMRDELAFQNRIADTDDYHTLPRGPIHADLFRDNVMFVTQEGQPTLSGFFDFYFAGVDTFLFDLAVCLNDWCVDPKTQLHQPALHDAVIRAYQRVRPLSGVELRMLPAMLRAGAFRFWLSRLWDLHLPRKAQVLKPHDPQPFERLLRARVAQASPASAEPSALGVT